MKKVYNYILISLIIVLIATATLYIGRFNFKFNKSNFEILSRVDESEKVNQDSSKTVLTYWTWVPTAKQQVPLIKEFENENPDIKIEGFGFDQDDYTIKIKLALASGEGPDLIGMQMGALQTETKRFLTELDDNLLDKEFGNNWRDLIEKSAMNEAVSYYGDGKLYSMPIGLSSQMFVYYNKTLFDKYGLTPPKDYNEWVKINKILSGQKENILPLTVGLKDTWFATDLFILLANQISPGITMKADKGEVKWTENVFEQAMSNVKKLKADGIFPGDAINNATYPYAADMFANRKCAQFMIGSWNAYNLGDSEVFGSKGFPVENDEFGAFVMPNVNGGKNVVIGGIDTAISINKKSENKETAVKFIKFMTLGKGQEIFVNTYSVLPVKIGQQIDTTKFSPVGKAGIQLFESALKNDMVATRQVTNPKLKDTIGVEVQNVFNGSDIKQALENIQKVAENRY